MIAAHGAGDEGTERGAVRSNGTGTGHFCVPNYSPHVEVRQLGEQAGRHERRQTATRRANGGDAAACIAALAWSPSRSKSDSTRLADDACVKLPTARQRFRGGVFERLRSAGEPRKAAVRNRRGEAAGSPSQD